MTYGFERLGNQPLILGFRVFIRRIRYRASGRIQPVEILLDFVRGHTQRERGSYRFGTLQECACMFQHELGDFVYHTNQTYQIVWAIASQNARSRRLSRAGRRQREFGQQRKMVGADVRPVWSKNWNDEQVL